MTLADIRDLIAGFGIAEDDNCYMGKMDDKADKSIGSYHLKRSGRPKIPLGGLDNASYDTFPASFLIHWNKSPRDTEVVSQKLFNALMGIKNATVNDTVVKFCDLLAPRPQDVGTDDKGIYEMVIEAEFYYEK